MKAFISYSHRDGWALDRLHTHLAMLMREGLIESWYDREILAGGEIDSEISEQLEKSDLFLLLVSPDFLASAYCFEREMTHALERHDAGEARVVPIIIEPCDWNSSPLRKLKALPRDGKPVSEWTNQNNAFLDVVTELRRIVDQQETAPAPTPRQAQPSRPDARRYRIKRDFDEIDRAEFGSRAFNVIRQYFEAAVAEINAIEGLRARFTCPGPQTFGCTVVNKAANHGTAHITVHAANGNRSVGDITWSFNENAPPNTANGWFTVESDEYDLFLKGSPFGFGSEEQRLTPDQAAERLWASVLEHAGVSYD